MGKAFTKESDRAKNYITPNGLQRLKDEHRFLLTRERPAVTKVVAWAAGNGDRSENADYQYGKRRLRGIDPREALQRTTWRRGRAEAVLIIPRVDIHRTTMYNGSTYGHEQGPRCGFRHAARARHPCRRRQLRLRHHQASGRTVGRAPAVDR